ncbi:MAG: hypothetical protein QGF59_07580, partial [Pirellulaceae bacterium]|nr:hypothetical protein [Pirellulaceae bacterium]
FEAERIIFTDEIQDGLVLDADPVSRTKSVEEVLVWMDILVRAFDKFDRPEYVHWLAAAHAARSARPSP